MRTNVGKLITAASILLAMSPPAHAADATFDTVTASKLILNGTGSTGDASGLSATLPLAGTVSRTLADRARDLPTPKDFGAYGDAKIVGATYAMAADSTALATTTPVFSAADVGKVIGVDGAGVTRTTGFVYQIGLSTTGQTCTGIPDIAINGAGGSGVGAYALPVLSLNGAAIASGGSGYANGTQTLTVDAAYGTPAQVTVTVSGGAVTAVQSVAIAGSFVPRDLLTGVDVTGGGGSGAKLNLSSVNLVDLRLLGHGIDYPVSGTTVSITGGACATAPVAAAPYIVPIVEALSATITAVADAQHVTLSAAAVTGQTARGADLRIGHDDTPAFAACVATKACRVPSGANYLVGDLAMPSGAALYADGGLMYADEVPGNASPGVTRLSAVSPILIAKPGATSVISLQGARNNVLHGVTIDCGGATTTDAFSAGSTLATLERVTANRCRYGFGSETEDTYTHAATVIGSQFSNGRAGIKNLIDSTVYGGAVTANKYGVALLAGSGGSNFIGVRSEFNEVYGLLADTATHVQWIGGLFDANYRAGAFVSNTDPITFSGVHWKRNGKAKDGAFLGNAHWVVQGSGNVVFSANQTEWFTGDDAGPGQWVPKYNAVYNGAAAVSVTGGNLAGWRRAPTNGALPTKYVYANNLGGGLSFNNAAQPFVANGIVAQTPRQAFAGVTPGQSSALTMTLAPMTADYSMYSRELVVTAINYNAPYQVISARFNLLFPRTTYVTGVTPSEAYGESGPTRIASFGTSSKLQLATSNVAADGSSFTLTLTNGGGSDGSSWGVWAELR